MSTSPLLAGNLSFLQGYRPGSKTGIAAYQIGSTPYHLTLQKASMCVQVCKHNIPGKALQLLWQLHDRCIQPDGWLVWTAALEGGNATNWHGGEGTAWHGDSNLSAWEPITLRPFDKGAEALALQHLKVPLPCPFSMQQPGI